MVLLLLHTVIYILQEKITKLYYILQEKITLVITLLHVECVGCGSIDRILHQEMGLRVRLYLSTIFFS